MAGETKFALERVAPAVFFISFAAIGWQLGLMRCLLIARYHHFSFLVISCALLGFGAGGAVLSLGSSWFEKHQERVFRWGTVGFALSLPICFRLGEDLPLNVYFPPALLIPTLGWWVAFWIIHCIPFLLAGLLIGLALMSAGKEAHRIYAVNLVGSQQARWAVFSSWRTFRQTALLFLWGSWSCCPVCSSSRGAMGDRNGSTPAAWRASACCLGPPICRVLTRFFP